MSHSDNAKPWASTANVCHNYLARHCDLIVAVWNGVLLFQRPWLSLAAFTGVNSALWLIMQTRIPTVSIVAVAIAGYIILTETVELSLTKWMTMLNITEPLQDLAAISDFIARVWYHFSNFPLKLKDFKEKNPTKYMPLISSVAMEVFLLGFLIPGHFVLRLLIFSVCLLPAMEFYIGIENLVNVCGEVLEALLSGASPAPRLEPSHTSQRNLMQAPEARMAPPSSSATPLPSSSTSNIIEEALSLSKFSLDPQFDPWGLSIAAETPGDLKAANGTKKDMPTLAIEPHQGAPYYEHDSQSESEWEKDFAISRTPSPAAFHAST